MRLVRNFDQDAMTTRVPCRYCGRMRRLADVDIDLDGTAFKAYYCTDKACAKSQQQQDAMLSKLARRSKGDVE